MICLKLLARASRSLCYQLGLGQPQKRVRPTFSPVMPQKKKNWGGIEIKENKMENQNGLVPCFICE